MNIANPVGNINQAKFAVGSMYGWRVHPITGENSFHFGIDIPAPSGTNVRAADEGVVSVSKRSDSAGNMIKILHTNGFITVYMHLSVRHVNVGEIVRPGDIIGSVGQTGNVTGNHLHFEIIDAGGTRFNPLECYQESIDISPYPIQTQQAPPPPDDNGKIPSWVWWAGGSLAVVGITALIVSATRDRE